jgi:hypothetical protein
MQEVVSGPSVSVLESERWLEEMNLGNEDPWTALLLLLLPNLQELNLSIPWGANYFSEICDGPSGR